MKTHLRFFVVFGLLFALAMSLSIFADQSEEVQMEDIKVGGSTKKPNLANFVYI